MHPPLPPPGFDDIPMAEKLEYVLSLWDRIAVAAEQIPVPEWYREILRERLQQMDSHPADSVDWGQLHSEIIGELHKGKPNR